MRKIKLTLNIGLISLIALSFTHSATLALFEFGTDSTATSISPLVSVGNINVINEGTTTKSTTGTITSTVQNLSSNLGAADVSVTGGKLQVVGPGTSFRIPNTTAGSDYQWISLTFTVNTSGLNPGESLKLTNYSYTYSSSSVANVVRVTSYIVTPFGGSAGTETFGANSSNSFDTNLNFGSADDDATVEFRIYYRDGSTGAAATHEFDNITLTGAVVVPEPSSILLLALGSSSLLLRRRRKAS